ncbi:hypothetical protein PoB_001641000 [Plakobranchus ocellatus]|uniref:Uncharacterized protein n=1 Tax=Plakobranchus ocellatus TaxID=259542 RepID=A0AAV3Z5T4_9GAST|nr:hypothetical protein PoB_001641000 [Plakobranchus ocellatus]
MSKYPKLHVFVSGGAGGTVDSESALASARTHSVAGLIPPPAPRSGGRPGSLRSPSCGQAICTNESHLNHILAYPGVNL